jgi:hypothetical protein
MSERESKKNQSWVLLLSLLLFLIEVIQPSATFVRSDFTESQSSPAVTRSAPLHFASGAHLAPAEASDRGSNTRVAKVVAHSATSLILTHFDIDLIPVIPTFYQDQLSITEYKYEIVDPPDVQSPIAFRDVDKMNNGRWKWIISDSALNLENT